MTSELIEDHRRVLEGSVRQEKNKLRVTVQLDQTSDGYHLWSHTYDSDRSNVLPIEQEIAQSIQPHRCTAVPHSPRSRKLGPGTINLRLGAVRRLAYEVSDCGLLSADLAAGIRQVKGVNG